MRLEKDSLKFLFLNIISDFLQNVSHTHTHTDVYISFKFLRIGGSLKSFFDISDYLHLSLFEIVVDTWTNLVNCLVVYILRKPPRGEESKMTKNWLT